MSTESIEEQSNTNHNTNNTETIEETTSTTGINNNTNTSTVTSSDLVSDPSSSPSCHPLQYQWVFWFTSPSNNGWQSAMKRVSVFSCVEDMWRIINTIKLPSMLSVKQDYYVFKAGIAPEWEDQQNKDGGKWTITINKGQRVDDAWIYTLLAAVGDTFTDSWELNGLVFSPRSKESRLSMWTRSANNEEAQRRIGKEWKECLNGLGIGSKMEYHSHHDTIVAGASHRTSITYSL